MADEQSSKAYVSVSIATVADALGASRAIGCGIEEFVDPVSQRVLGPEERVLSFYLVQPERFRRYDQQDRFSWAQDSFRCYLHNSRNEAWWARKEHDPDDKRRAAFLSEPVRLDEISGFLCAEFKGFASAMERAVEAPAVEQPNDFALVRLVDSLQAQDVALAGRIKHGAAIYMAELRQQNEDRFLLLDEDRQAAERFDAFLERHKDLQLESESFEFSQGLTYHFIAKPELLAELEQLGLIDRTQEGFIVANAILNPKPVLVIDVQAEPAPGPY